MGIADGTSIIPAVSQDFPVRYVATIYGEFPSVVFGKASSGVNEGGRPGRHPPWDPRVEFGLSWIMLQALLGSGPA